MKRSEFQYIKAGDLVQVVGRSKYAGLLAVVKVPPSLGGHRCVVHSDRDERGEKTYSYTSLIPVSWVLLVQFLRGKGMML